MPGHLFRRARNHVSERLEYFLRSPDVPHDIEAEFFGNDAGDALIDVRAPDQEREAREHHRCEKKPAADNKQQCYIHCDKPLKLRLDDFSNDKITHHLHHDARHQHLDSKRIIEQAHDVIPVHEIHHQSHYWRD